MRAPLLLLSALPAIDPRFARNITVYHVNEHKFGAIPFNMDTGDATGDMLFDMVAPMLAPLKCRPGNEGHIHFPNPCINPEATGEDLMVNKLTLEVDARFSQYAACNVCVDGHDWFGDTCESGKYSCNCFHGIKKGHRQVVPCNGTVGKQSLSNFGGRVGPCQPTRTNPDPTEADCFGHNVFSKMNPRHPGAWYSTLAQGHCGPYRAGRREWGSCTWRVVSVDKIVKRSCHKRAFGEAVAAHAPDCFHSCGDQQTNTSSVCWTECFFKAALGPEAGRIGGKVDGISIEELTAAWETAFLPEELGGCPPQVEITAPPVHAQLQ